MIGGSIVTSCDSRQNSISIYVASYCTHLLVKVHKFIKFDPSLLNEQKDMLFECNPPYWSFDCGLTLR